MLGRIRPTNAVFPDSAALYTTHSMQSPIRHALVGLLVTLILGANLLDAAPAGSAYSGHPKLVVIVVIDQFRGDYLDRYRDEFREDGFRMFLDHGAVFSNCDYNYANTRTAPGHATLLTGAYSNGHGIIANEWYDPDRKTSKGALEPGAVTSVWDANTKFVGTTDKGEGAASPHNLRASTLGDELKLATQGKSRVFAISLKDRAAILPGGFSANGAFWIEKNSGAWITSDYYEAQLPGWVQDFNGSKRKDKYWDVQWRDAAGHVLGTTASKKKDGKPAAFYDAVGSTPFANDYEFEFARDLITQEKLGAGPATDLLVISLSANDILGHQAGPDSPEMHAMALALDAQISGFFGFLGQQIGLANVWVALSADHGVAPVPSVAKELRIPAAGFDSEKLKDKINALLSAKLAAGKTTAFLKSLDYPTAWLDDRAFTTLHLKEADAEHAVGEALVQIGMQGYFTKSQLAAGAVPNDETGIRYLHSYSPLGGWYVLGVPAPYTIGGTSGTDHASPYHYDRHVPLAFYGLAFRTGVYRTQAEPVDLAVTLASLLGINAPSHAVGRVLTEALASSNASNPANVSHGEHP